MVIAYTVCFCKKKTDYELRISEWVSDVCSSDLDKYPVASFAGDVIGGIPLALGGTRLLTQLGMNAPRAALATDAATGAYFGSGENKDRKSVVKGKSVSVRVDLGGCRIIKKNHSIKVSSTSSHHYINRVA